MTLDEAWKKRQELGKQASELLKKADDFKKGMFHAPANAKATMWFAACSSFYEAHNAELNGNLLRYKADELWYNAIIENKGNIKLLWEDDEKGGWKCTLESGEVYGPE